MNQHDSNNIADKVEAYVAGDLGRRDADRFEQELKDDPVLRQQVKDADAILSALEQTELPRAPRTLQRSVLTATDTGFWSGLNLSSGGWLVAAATSAALVLTLSWSSVFPPEPAPLQLTAAEVVKGRQDLALALAYLDRSTNLASRKVGDTWVNDGLLKPVNAGLNRQRLSSEDSAS